MKRYAPLITILASVILIVSCKDDPGHRPEATGSPYEVLVVIDDNLWEGPLGDTLTSVLAAPVPMLNQKEPLTDVYQVSSPNFKGLLLRYGNVINVGIDPSLEIPNISLRYDVSSRGQQMIDIVGPDVLSVTQFVSWNRDKLIQVIYMAERERYIKKMALSPAKDVMQAVRNIFGFDMTIPTGYTIYTEESDFMWLSFELRLASLGMAIYSYPYTNRNDFTLDSLLSKRNEFVARIPGPGEGTYMKTASLEPMVSYIRIDGRLWAYMSGLWNIHGDFLGGPFRSYTTLDEETQRMICVDSYVMAPNESKRNYVKQLETMIYTAKFPGDDAKLNSENTPTEADNSVTE